MVAQLQTALGPGIEVVAGGDLATNASALANGPELREGGAADDRGLVDALALVDVVAATVALHGATALPLAGVVGAVSIDDIVLNERVLCPAVESEVRVGVGCVPCAVVFDRLGTAGFPALAVWNRSVVSSARWPAFHVSGSLHVPSDPVLAVVPFARVGIVVGVLKRD